MICKVTYEEVLEAKKLKEEAVKNYHGKFYDYLVACLEEAGFLYKRVRVKKTGIMGVIKIVSKYLGASSPFEYKFYPTKKDGTISVKSQYVWGLLCADKDIPKMLSEVFESVGDTNED